MIVSGFNTTGIYNYNQSVYMKPEMNVNAGMVKSADDNRLQEIFSDVKNEYNASETASFIQTVDFAIETLGIDRSLMENDSDINGLDVQKAVSDMRQDIILHQYQYFIGNIDTEDGIVMRKM